MKLLKKTFNEMKLGALAVFVLSSLSAQAQTNIIYDQLTYPNLTPETNVTMTLTLVSPRNRASPNTIGNGPIQTITDTNGYYYFTNVLWGVYQLTANDSSSTRWNVYIGTNTLGQLKLSSLIQSAAVLPPNPSTNYLTEAEVYALFAQIQQNTSLLNAGAIMYNEPGISEPGLAGGLLLFNP